MDFSELQKGCSPSETQRPKKVAQGSTGKTLISSVLKNLVQGYAHVQAVDHYKTVSMYWHAQKQDISRSEKHFNALLG
eukprot:1139293-Pelagomonas_calceolata.AAC.18